MKKTRLMAFLLVFIMAISPLSVFANEIDIPIDAMRRAGILSRIDLDDFSVEASLDLMTIDLLEMSNSNLESLDFRTLDTAEVLPAEMIRFEEANLHSMSEQRSSSPILNNFFIEGVHNPDSLVNGNISTDTQFVLAWNHVHPNNRRIVNIASAGFNVLGGHFAPNGELLAISVQVPTAGVHSLLLLLIDEDGFASNVLSANLLVVEPTLPNIAHSVTINVDAPVEASLYRYGARPRLPRHFQPTFRVYGEVRDSIGRPVANQPVIVWVEFGYDPWGMMVSPTVVWTDINGNFSQYLTSEVTAFVGFFTWWTGMFTTHHYNVCIVFAEIPGNRDIWGHQLFYWLVANF